MPLVGGGGSPNVAGSNPSGIGKGLNYVGDFAYAYSGLVAVAPTETTILDFSTGGSLFVGTIQFLYASQADTAPADDCFYKLEINSESVLQYLDTGYGSNHSRSPHDPSPIIIAPFSKVTVSAEMGSSNTINQVCLIVGRVYE